MRGLSWGKGWAEDKRAPAPKAHEGAQKALDGTTTSNFQRCFLQKYNQP